MGAELERRGLHHPEVDLAELPVEADARHAEGIALVREHDPAVAVQRLLGMDGDQRLHRVVAAVLREVHAEAAAVAVELLPSTPSTAAR